MSFNCWRGPAVLQVFAGMPAPTRSCPSLRKECLPYTKDNPREKSEEPFFSGIILHTLRKKDRQDFEKDLIRCQERYVELVKGKEEH